MNVTIRVIFCVISNIITSSSGYGARICLLERDTEVVRHIKKDQSESEMVSSMDGVKVRKVGRSSNSSDSRPLYHASWFRPVNRICEFDVDASKHNNIRLALWGTPVKLKLRYGLQCVTWRALSSHHIPHRWSMIDDRDLWRSCRPWLTCTIFPLIWLR